MFNYRTCCRLCLKEKRITVNCEEINDLSQKIEDVFGLKISKNDGLSTKICKDCTYQVTSFAVFRESVLYNRITIENYRNLESKIEKIKTEELDDDVVFVKEEDKTEVTSSTQNEIPDKVNRTTSRNSVTPSENELRLKTLKNVLQPLDTKKVLGLKIKANKQKGLKCKSRRKSFSNAIKRMESFGMVSNMRRVITILLLRTKDNKFTIP